MYTMASIDTTNNNERVVKETADYNIKGEEADQ